MAMKDMYKATPSLGTGAAEKAKKALEGRKAQLDEALGNDLNGGPIVYKNKVKPK